MKIESNVLNAKECGKIGPMPIIRLDLAVTDAEAKKIIKLVEDMMATNDRLLYLDDGKSADAAPAGLTSSKPTF